MVSNGKGEAREKGGSSCGLLLWMVSVIGMVSVCS